MIPTEIRNNNSVRDWRRLAMSSHDPLDVEEHWCRMDDERDGDGKYYGEWKDVTSITQAQWDLKRTEEEMERMQKDLLKQAVRR